MQISNAGELFKTFEQINSETIIHSPIFVTIVGIVVFVVFMRFVHIVMKNFTKNVIKTTVDNERIKEIKTISHVIQSVIDTVLVLIFVMVLLTKLGIDIRPILTAAGILGVAVGFGAKRFVEDIITGMIILLEGQIRVGDVIQIGDKTGFVEKIDLKVVVLRDTQGRVHYIRNGMIDIVTNMTRDFSYYVIDLKVSAKENADSIITALKDVFNDGLMVNNEMSSNVLEEIEILGVDSFSGTSLTIKARIKTKPMSQWTVGREFNRLIKNKFDELKIDFS